MEQTKISLSIFLDAYGHNIGIEGARKVIERAVTQAGLPHSEEYTREEALKICEQLKKHEGFVKVIANFLVIQLTPEVQELVAKIKILEADSAREHSEDKFHLINYQ